LDETNKTNEKLAALLAYFREAPPADAAWAIFLLTGRKVRQLIPSAALHRWSAEAAGIPQWLLNESYDVVGDGAETMALVLPETEQESTLPLCEWIEERLLPLRSQTAAEQRAALRQAWQELSSQQRFVLHKIITGAFRVGVSERLVIRALAKCGGLKPEVVAHRLLGDWTPDESFHQRLCAHDASDTAISQPYPFFLAHPLTQSTLDLGPIDNWQWEWKWDGIRAQLVRRGGQSFIWSRGDELVTERFPELAADLERLPHGTVIDGELVAWQDNHAASFSLLQTRIGRKYLSPKVLREAPVMFLAFDLLEQYGRDIREEQLSVRRRALEECLAAAQPLTRLQLSPLIAPADWPAAARLREQSREHHAEGLMLKRRDSAYGVGRPRGDWWKWKVDPYVVDAVLVYAQPGSGKRASLFTDYTFALWDQGELVPFAKAYSGLDDDEIRQVDAFVRRHTRERFGPVRVVKPELVFELAFESIRRSSRHRAGVAVRFPRIARWRKDKRPQEADTLETLRALLPDLPAADPGSKRQQELF
jgi:DNA ligase-1